MFGPMFIQSAAGQSRDPVQSEQLYSPGVLIGNWFENCRRYSCDYRISKSIYNTDYKVPYPQHICEYDMPDRIAQHNGVGGELLLHHGDECYKRNFISSYDLHYRVLASNFRDHRKYSKRLRTLVPEQDFALCYNTLTQCGISEKNCECPVKPYMTEYNDSYVTQTCGLRKARVAVPRDNSTATAMAIRKVVPPNDSEPMMSNYKPPENSVFEMCNSEYIISVQSQPPFAVESIIVYLLVILLSFPVAYFPSQENLREEYEKKEAVPTPVYKTPSQVLKQEESTENCECLESNGSQDSFISAEDNELTDGNLTSKQAVEQKMNLLEDHLKALMKPWNVEEVDSSDQQSTSDYVMETTNYCQSDETGNERDNSGAEEPIAPELDELLSSVLQNTWLTDSTIHDDVLHTTPNTKVFHTSNKETSTSASDELMETESSQIKPGYSAVLDNILTLRENDCRLNLKNIEPPFAVEYISKEEARRRRWLPPKKKYQGSTMLMPCVYEYEWNDKEDSQSNDPTTNVYYCVTCQRSSVEETFVEKSSPRNKLPEFNNIKNLIGKDKMKQRSFEQAENIFKEKIDQNMHCDINRSKDCDPLNADIGGSTKPNDRVLSEYQEQLICGHINYLITGKDRITLSGEGPGEMNWKSVCLPENISKCGLHKGKHYLSRQFIKENQDCETDTNEYDTDGEERKLHNDDHDSPLFKNNDTATTRFDEHGANFCSHIPPETNCLDSDPLQLAPCKDYSPFSGNVALKSDVTGEANGGEYASISSLPATFNNNNNQLQEEIITAMVCSHDQERFVASQSFKVNDIPSISRKRRRASVHPKDDASDEYSTN